MAKKDMKKASTNVKNCKKNNVTNANNNKVTDKKDIGFKNESHSFELDRDNDKSFELE